MSAEGKILLWLFATIFALPSSLITNALSDKSLEDLNFGDSGDEPSTVAPDKFGIEGQMTNCDADKDQNLLEYERKSNENLHRMLLKLEESCIKLNADSRKLVKIYKQQREELVKSKH